MSIYLIDYENVHEGGLSGVKDLPEGDRVIVFYGDKIKSISFDVHVQMMNSKAVVEYIETHKTAKNYLDFQLGTYLGFLIGSGSRGDLVIVSNDTGFDSVVDFWTDRGKVISRRENISEKAAQANVQAHEKEPAKKSTGSKNGKSQNRKGKTQEKQQEKAQEKPEKAEKTAADKAPAAQEAAEAQAPEKPVSNVQEAPVKTGEARDRDHEKNEAQKNDPGKKEAEASKKDPQKKPDLPESYRKKVRAALRSDKLSSGNYTTIYRALAGSRDKLSLNNTLVKAYGSEKGGEVYNRIRDIFAEYQNAQNHEH